MGNQTKRFNPLKKAVGTALINGNGQFDASIIIDSGNLYSERPNVSGYYSTTEELAKIKDGLLEIIQDDQAKDIDKWSYVYITDLQKFIDKTKISLTDFQYIIRESINAHVAIILAANNSFITSDMTGIGNTVKQNVKSMVLAMRKQDQHIIEATYDQNEIDPEIGTVWTEFERRFEKIKIVDKE